MSRVGDLSARAAIAIATALACVACGHAQIAGGAWAAANDYGRADAWLCRPGKESDCTTSLDAIAVDAAGTRTAKPFRVAVDPPVDCFYVYPTVSAEPTPYSDMQAGPEEIATAHDQAGRFASRCRVFAPIYRQLTGAGLGEAMSAGREPDFAPAYADVRDAWKAYLARDNHGRGVVLIGHSQGAILLARLVAEEIDGKPDQQRLVSALLAGHTGLGVPAGRKLGGLFKHIPLCGSASQTGCVFVWSSYAADDRSDHKFGRNPGRDLKAACVNPAAPGGGPGLLDAFFPKPALAPRSDPPYVEVVASLSARCETDAQGEVLRVTVEPSRYAALLRTALAPRSQSTWGLHPIDVALTQGNLLALVQAESRSWKSAHP